MSDEADKKDGFDRLLDAMEATHRDVKLVAADLEVTRDMVGHVRDRLSNVENRVDALEKAEKRNVDYRRGVSEVDAKAASDQAAFVLALEETRSASIDALKIAKEALEVSKSSDGKMKEAVDNTKQAYDAARLAYASAAKGLTTIAAVKTNQDTQTTAIQEIKTEEQKKPKVPMTLAAMLNLTIGLVYLILEALHRYGH